MDVFFLQVFVFTDGEVTDTFTVVREVKSHRLRHRYELMCLDPHNVTCNLVPSINSIHIPFRQQNDSSILVLILKIFFYIIYFLLKEKISFLNNINTTMKSLSCGVSKPQWKQKLNSTIFSLL